MQTNQTRMAGLRRFLTVSAIIALGTVGAARAAIISYTANLDGPSESPPVASAGIGFAQVDIDDVALTMRVFVSFSGLSGTTTASHIHAATAVAGSGVAGVAVGLSGFPTGVTSGTYDVTFDMTLAASYGASYVSANGGTASNARAALYQAIVDNKAYVNIHSTLFGGGEIRGFLVPITIPVDQASWGEIKSHYR